MNVNEYGVQFLFGVGFTLTAQTNLALHMTKPDGSLLTITSGVAVGSGTITTPLGIFLDQQYSTYTFTAGQIDQAGTWEARLYYTDSTPRLLISSVATFIVNP